MSVRQDRHPHPRRSLRLRHYDYAQVGAYFVTVCAYDRRCLFGDVVDGAMRLNDVGRIIADEWHKSARIRAEIELDTRVIMPNHFHGIAVITHRRGDRPVAPTGPPPRSIGALMAGFKSASTKRINAARGTPGARVWQRNYYDHVIRNEADLHRIRQYIADNPARWAEDPENPARSLDAAPVGPGGIRRTRRRGDRPVAPTRR